MNAICYCLVICAIKMNPYDNFVTLVPREDTLAVWNVGNTPLILIETILVVLNSALEPRLHAYSVIKK